MEADLGFEKSRTLVAPRERKEKCPKVRTGPMYEEETAAGLAEEEGHAALLEVLAEGLDLAIRETSDSEPHAKYRSEGEDRGVDENEDESKAS
ncbi:hypothetical protein F52700_4286 [Fusarium sp. NRRL 52700]|nr:hypothetical protein F52700_4286 [Fusarium sp. NRRL 52700]